MNGDLGAECRLRKTNRNFEIQVDTIAPESRMPRYGEKDVEIAGRSIAQACFAVTGDTDAASVIDSRRNLDGQRLVSFGLSAPEARFARVRNHLSGTVALPARALRDELSERRLTNGSLRACSAATLAGENQRPRSGAGTFARDAWRHVLEGNLALRSFERFFESDLDIVTQILTARGALSALRLRLRRAAPKNMSKISPKPSPANPPNDRRSAPPFTPA